MTKPTFSSYKDHIKTIVNAALVAANPAKQVAKHIDEIRVIAENHQNIWVVGAGKASLEMALELHTHLGEEIKGGAVAVVPERLEQLDESRRASLPFGLYPATHPLATEQNVVAAEAIADVARQVGENDLLIVLISGGGSAHLALPVEGLELSKYQAVINQLMRAGATIEELNAVRKHAEQLKGGGLLRLAAPGRVHALILSDVIGDPLDVIASGPISADPTTFADALGILTRHEIELPPALAEHLSGGVRGEIPETVKPADPILDLATHAMLGNNILAVEAVRTAAEKMGFAVAHVETGIQGEAGEIGVKLVQLARKMTDLPAIAIFGGETTVTVKGDGLGGRNQEMILAAALAVDGMENIAVLSLATDGVDGPTSAAGAYADGTTCQRAKSLSLDPAAYLANNDSFSFFNELNDLIEIGPTGTNVNDISVLLVYSGSNELMKKETLYPLTFTPVLKDYIWGGRNLEKLGRRIPAEGVTAESWEIAGHKDGTTPVANGALAGTPLTDLLAQYGAELVGHNNAWALERGKFPLLIKLLDASRSLSVQVHPKDDYALKHEGNELGKTEMWVIVHAEPGAKVMIGVKAGTTPENFRQAITDGDLEKYLHSIPVKVGDHVDVPAGTLHAIMDGVIIAEIQQNSNTTYRVYDWNRVGADGNPRPLHVDKAMDVINFEQVEPILRDPKLLANENGIRRSTLVSNQYFITERIEMQAGSTYQGECNGDTMEIWGLISGNIAVNETDIEAIQFILLPAALGEFSVRAVSDAVVLRTYVG